ncbi:MFS general substrate transporter [Cutaneotrichosporon oleaginosum]|uniref:MFS general substrate transporter n=1 Tax=Cutaneotrichosporon oleaginosum TaxID=879819 RepID=A0A0J0XZD0_9TREE|nr:MFS general substrate transporter [Cutaneotrichosporon oleaginosum]KLT46388.1 MFS general substrate transporter [Cutaneotrichosporon oleaginosum]TXT15242.1 hypothetical protein COLE_01435 [Cutaneotrichosporon oleaginosum]
MTEDTQLHLSERGDNSHLEASSHNGAIQVADKSAPYLSAPDTHDVEPPNSLSSLSQVRKNILFACFCLTIFIDGAGNTAMFVMVSPIARSLSIPPSREGWIPTSYAMVFAALMLLAGRLADLYPPHIVFTSGYFGLGAMWLAISFAQDQYTFFTLRAICALFAVLTVPSSLNMIVQMFPDKVTQAKRLALFGMAGALASTLSPILVGLFLLSSWRWFFRFVACIAIPFSLFARAFMPLTHAVAQAVPGRQKWRRLDLGGVFLLVGALVLFMFAFSEASAAGWTSPSFYAPLIVSLALLAAFVIWEHCQPDGLSLLPPDIWHYSNIGLLIILGLLPAAAFSTYSMRCAVYFQDALGDTSIVAALKLIPMGAVAVIAGLLCQPFPVLMMRPRIVQPIACLLTFAGTMLLAFSGGGWGADYWRYIFPAQLIGTFGAMLVFIGVNCAIIQSFPFEYAGVAGSFAQVVFTIGSVVGIAIQSGLVATGQGGTDWTGDRNAYVFLSAYCIAAGALCGALFRNPLPKIRTSDIDGVA